MPVEPKADTFIDGVWNLKDRVLNSIAGVLNRNVADQNLINGVLICNVGVRKLNETVPNLKKADQHLINRVLICKDGVQDSSDGVLICNGGVQHLNQAVQRLNDECS